MDTELIQLLWMKGVNQFNSGKFFECHETLEEIWVGLEEGESKRFIQGIIHLAVGHYHHETGNLIGRNLQYRKAFQKLQTIDQMKTSSLFNCDVQKILDILNQQMGERISIPFIALEAKS
ncbi:DUF309 domain-containing protein [bacterium]|nr:DUF309 domain-containing protein [bacterium]